jgi:hypothetical protein
MQNTFYHILIIVGNDFWESDGFGANTSFPDSAVGVCKQLNKL